MLTILAVVFKVLILLFCTIPFSASAGEKEVIKTEVSDIYSPDGKTVVRQKRVDYYKGGDFKVYVLPVDGEKGKEATKLASLPSTPTKKAPTIETSPVFRSSMKMTEVLPRVEPEPVPKKQPVKVEQPPTEEKGSASVALRLSGEREREACAQRGLEYTPIKVSRTPDSMIYGVTLRGIASWYGKDFDGKPLRYGGGEKYNMCDTRLVAMNDYPGGTILEVRNPDNGNKGLVIVMDTGRLKEKGVKMDLSYGAAQMLGIVKQGKAEVEYRIIRLPQKGETPETIYASLVKRKVFG